MHTAGTVQVAPGSTVTLISTSIKPKLVSQCTSYPRYSCAPAGAGTDAEWMLHGGVAVSGAGIVSCWDDAYLRGTHGRYNNITSSRQSSPWSYTEPAPHEKRVAASGAAGTIPLGALVTTPLSLVGFHYSSPDHSVGSFASEVGYIREQCHAAPGNAKPMTIRNSYVTQEQVR